MMSNGSGAGRRRRRLLTPEQKYELWLAMLRDDASQRELADKWGVDRTTVVRIRQVAKHGALSALAASRPGGPAPDGKDAELKAAEEEIARLTDTVKEQAIELAMLRGKQRGAW
jgi:transposase